LDGDLPEKERNALDARAEQRPPAISAISLWEAQICIGSARASPEASTR